MSKPRTIARHDGWTVARRRDFLGALRVTGSVRDAAAWAGLSPSSAYRLARRDAGFATGWQAALAAREIDRPRREPVSMFDLSNGEIMRRLFTLERQRAQLSERSGL